MRAIDHGGLGSTHPTFERTVLAIADWQEGRDRCRHSLDEQINAPCDGPLHSRTAGARRRFYVLEAEHSFCGDRGYVNQAGKWERQSTPGGWLVTWELLRRRPGARAPWDGCHGCFLSFFGELEMDKSLLSAFRGYQPTADPSQVSTHSRDHHRRAAAAPDTRDEPRADFRGIPAIVQQLVDPVFLAWYAREFRNPRLLDCHWSARQQQAYLMDYVVAEQTIVRPVQRTDCRTDYVVEVTTELTCLADGRDQADRPDVDPLSSLPGASAAQIDALLDMLVHTSLRERVPVGNFRTHPEMANEANAQEILVHAARDWWVWIDPRTRQLRPCTERMPRGWLYFPDWMRGRALERIQEATRLRWARQ